ncbi:MAG: hypothetical protein JWQ23_1302 [Herminiimonas sp.]|nr:hypothetical protein [Herminiimonas sp.]
MKKYLLPCLLACSALLTAWPVSAQPKTFSFGVIAQAFKKNADDSILREAIADSDADNLAFVVANGIKGDDEPCSDKLYSKRKKVFESAKNGLVLSLTGNDWIECKTANGRPASIERLSRVRDVFFSDEFTFGASKIPLVRQSATPKFNTYVENARWEFGDILFATINLPANNNYYLPDAGRNGEFEDRLIANRDWLKRLAVIATRKKLDGIVIFCDGNESLIEAPGKTGKRDGFAEMRKEIAALAARFQGKVLLIQGQGGANQAPMNRIAWRGNLGNLVPAAGWTKVTVERSNPALFTVSENTVIVGNQR